MLTTSARTFTRSTTSGARTATKYRDGAWSRILGAVLYAVDRKADWSTAVLLEFLLESIGVKVMEILQLLI
jgi:hypothetical protein